jgi:peptidoglycan/xylan/chitin deacetylase (PgdA/CDA1 family)
MKRKWDLPTTMNRKHLIFRAGLSVLSKTGAAALMAGRTRGLGAILMFHHVRPYQPKAFDPHRILEITPEFLDAVLSHVREKGYEIIPLDALADRVRNPQPGRPFVVLTFDDGYRDNAEFALPVLRKHNAPFTVFATTGFADGGAPLWWLDLEDAAERGLPGQERQSPAEAFSAAYAALRPRSDLQQEIARLAAAAGIDGAARTRRLCLHWDGLRALAADPLCTIGAHTLTHPLLGTLDERAAHREMAQCKAILEDKLQLAVRHIAYPVGDALAAGTREFALARELGFETGLTTRPGVLFPEHQAHLHALPRLSVNGLYQSIGDFDVLLSGAAFWLFNRGRKLNVA